MLRVSCKSNPDWLQLTIEGLKYEGYTIVEDILDELFLDQTRVALYSAQQKIRSHIGDERLARAGELGVLRLMLKYEPHFLKFLEIPEVLEVVDSILSNTAILHLQNGLVLPFFPKDKTPEVFQNKFHQDFNRVLNGYMASVNLLFAIDEFTSENGGTLIVPATHQQAQPPTHAYLEANANSVTCPAGSAIVFDSTLWHAAGVNLSAKDRLGINHQFTRSYIKQQIDYVRALGDEIVTALPPRTQQLLGWYTRVVTSLDEYYVPADQRLYRSGQG